MNGTITVVGAGVDDAAIAMSINKDKQYLKYVHRLPTA